MHTGPPHPTAKQRRRAARAAAQLYRCSHQQACNHLDGTTPVPDHPISPNRLLTATRQLDPTVISHLIDQLTDLPLHWTDRHQLTGTHADDTATVTFTCHPQAWTVTWHHDHPHYPNPTQPDRTDTDGHPTLTDPLAAARHLTDALHHNADQLAHLDHTS